MSWLQGGDHAGAWGEGPWEELRDTGLVKYPTWCEPIQQLEMSREGSYNILSRSAYDLMSRYDCQREPGGSGEKAYTGVYL